MRSSSGLMAVPQSAQPDVSISILTIYDVVCVTIVMVSPVCGVLNYDGASRYVCLATINLQILKSENYFEIIFNSGATAKSDYTCQRYYDKNDSW